MADIHDSLDSSPLSGALAPLVLPEPKGWSCVSGRANNLPRAAPSCPSWCWLSLTLTAPFCPNGKNRIFIVVRGELRVESAGISPLRGWVITLFDLIEDQRAQCCHRSWFESRSNQVSMWAEYSGFITQKEACFGGLETLNWP